MNGSLGVYDALPTWTAEEFQRDASTTHSLEALPCLYCDATQPGTCQNLSARLASLYANEAAFIESTLVAAEVWGWAGFSLDLEPDDTVDVGLATDFVLRWAAALTAHNLTLSLWISCATPYDDRIYNASVDFGLKLRLVTMDTCASQQCQCRWQHGADGGSCHTRHGATKLPNYSQRVPVARDCPATGTSVAAASLFSSHHGTCLYVH